MAVNDVVSRNFLANLLGVDVRTIKNLVDEGMPKADRGRYSLGACVPWYIQREREAARGSKGLNDLDLARQRKTVAEARRAELDVAEAEGQVIPTELHAERLRERLATVAGAVKAIGRYHADVKAVTTDVAADQLLERMADEILAELYALSDTID
jgi:phage terminase Nu1 subunit (DNA packaging protein)